MRAIGWPVQPSAYPSGLMGLSSRRDRAHGAVILMYHSVADATTNEWIDPANHVPAHVFERQMEFLSAERVVMSLDDLVRALRNNQSLRPGSTIVTFDDGYLDNLTVAAPVQERFRLAATIFLPTGYIDRGENQWVEQVTASSSLKAPRR